MGPLSATEGSPRRVEFRSRSPRIGLCHPDDLLDVIVEIALMSRGNTNDAEEKGNVMTTATTNEISLRTAERIEYHAAAHLAAHAELGRGVKQPQIVAEGKYAVWLKGVVGETEWDERLEAAGSDAKWGRSIDNKTRRGIEIEIMYLLAGAVFEMDKFGVNRRDAGMGLSKQDERLGIAHEVADHDEPSLWEPCVPEGDYDQAAMLAWQVSADSDLQAHAYLTWLEQRTRNMIRRPTFIDEVESIVSSMRVLGLPRRSPSCLEQS